MKYDINQKQTLGAKRTLKAFSDAIATLFSQKSFEDITVQEICDESLIPRATFYNYFDDKYDLLSYTLQSALKCIYPEMDEKMDHRANFIKLINNIIDFIQNHVTKIEAILLYNPSGSYLYNELYRFLTDCALRIGNASTDNWKYIVPDSMIAKRNASSLMIVIEWAFVENKNISRDVIVKNMMALMNCDTLIDGKK